MSPSRLKVCVDRPLPLSDQTAAAATAMRMRPTNAPLAAAVPAGDPVAAHVSMAIGTTRLWPAGQTVRVRFLDGDDWQREHVRTIAPEWSQHANVHFAFDSTDADAEIRLSFVAGAGSWSRLGTDCLADPENEATMNLGWIDRDEREEEIRSVILHEFGHALGCIHEHMSPAAEIPWDKPVVYEYYARTQDPPWSKDQVDHNLFKVYDRSITRFSEFDAHSIMIYAIPEEHTVGDYHIDATHDLSAQDKSFIRATYADPTIKQLTVGVRAPGEIGKPGQEDLYELTIDEGGQYTVATSGPTDVRMAIYGPDDRTRYIANDDDSGRDGYNASLTALLMPGNYVVRVRHEAGSGGTYEVAAAAA